jgi:predicted RNA-binding protein with TRAM domain
VELEAKIASLLIGPGAARLVELEALTRRRFYLEAKEGVHLDHFLVLEEGKRDEIAPSAPVEEGADVELKLVEVGLHDPGAGVGKLDGLDVSVADAAKLVGKKVKVQVERVLDGTAYATLVTAKKQAGDAPITAEGEAEKPTRKPPARKAEAAAEPSIEPEAAEAEEPAAEEPEATDEAEAAASADEASAPAKKKTRRGTRGGRGRKRPATAAASANGGDAEAAAAKIHVPDPSLGAEDAAQPEAETAPEEPAPSENGAEAEQPAAQKKKTRRGTRGGRGRKKKPAGVTADAAEGAEAQEASEPPADETWDYVPMSEWGDEVDGS